MDRFGIGNIGLTGFGIGGFRIPAFGSGSGVSHGNQLHESLVDAWFMSGYANGDSPAYIRGVKGNELVLRNFAYALDSGFGKYTVDFTKYTGDNTTSNSISIYKKEGINIGIAGFNYNQLASNIPSYFVEIKGLDSGDDVSYHYRNNDGLENKATYSKDGVYKLPVCYKEGTQGTRVSFVTHSMNEVTITQLPSAYEGGLVFDGVDDYGICTGLPILDDYTVICRREIINKNYYSIASKSTVVGEGGFIFEVIQDRTNYCYSFGVDNRINLYNGEISWQTKNSYNGNTIKAGDKKDSDTLTLGIIREGDASRRFLQGAIYYFALYNKSLTPEEIETEKAKLENMWDSKLNKS